MRRTFPTIYVADVVRTVRFYEEAFGATCDHLHEDGSYAELLLGSLTLGVVDATYAARHFPGRFRRHRLSDAPAGFAIYVEVSDADEAARDAVRAGATSLGDPVDRPWGQRNAFIRDPDGFLVELASVRG